MYYTGINTYTGEEVYSAHNDNERHEQHQAFFWYKSQNTQREYTKPQHNYSKSRDHDLQENKTNDRKRKSFNNNFNRNNKKTK